MTCKDICKLVYSERREKKTSSPSSLGAARKELMLSKIAIFRVAKIPTLKMPKVVIISDLCGAQGVQHW